MNDEARALIARINKQAGEGTVVIASDMKVHKRFTSGSLSLDIALGGGWPANQWIEVRGRESHGKTAIVLKTIAANQAADPEFTTLWVAAEHYDIDQAVHLGVDNERVIVVPTQEMEFAYQTMLDFASSRSVDCIVLDSYPALIPNDEAAKDMDEMTVALGARLTGKFFRKAGAATKRSLSEDDRPMIGFVINQFRDQIGGFSPMGVPQTTPGGKAKNYAFYVQVDVKRDEFIDEQVPGKNLKIRVGQTIKVKTIKNKSAPPHQVASIDFYFRDAPQSGFSRGQYDEVKEITTLGIFFDVIERRGAYYDFDGQRWQGKDALIKALRDDPDLRSKAREEILSKASAATIEMTEDDLDRAANDGVRKVKIHASQPA